MWNWYSATSAATPAQTTFWITATSTPAATSSSWDGWDNVVQPTRGAGIYPIRSPAPVWQAPRPAIIRARAPAEIAAREAAAARARGLLLGELDAKQRAEFERDGSFVVVGRLGRYRIRKAIAANVDLLGWRERVKHRLCAHPVDTGMPKEDIMLAQLIHLRHDEEGFLKIANRHAAPGVDAFTDRHLVWAEQRLAA